MSTYATSKNSKPATEEELPPYRLNNVNTELEFWKKEEKGWYYARIMPHCT